VILANARRPTYFTMMSFRGYIGRGSTVLIAFFEKSAEFVYTSVCEGISVWTATEHASCDDGLNGFVEERHCGCGVDYLC